MERYQNGKIYKLVCNITGKVYIGSTCKKLLSQRLTGHVSDFKRGKENDRHKMSSFEIIEGNNYYIELIELVPCSSKDELIVRERFHIKNNACVNIHRNLGMTKYGKEYDKEYYKNNIDKIKSKTNCPFCSKEMCKKCLPRHLRNNCKNN